jgi:DNA gyrase inhibitor GyrI
MNTMTANVQFIKLPDLHVASALGYGHQPETQAWQKLTAWMRAHRMMEDLSNLRFFGFNNPNPSAGSPNYGYEQWVTISIDIEPEEGIKVLDVPCGFYATLECPLTTIGETWGELVNWQAGSKYRIAPGQCLEECLTPEILIGAPEGIPMTIENVGNTRFRLYLPLIEAS